MAHKSRTTPSQAATTPQQPTSPKVVAPTTAPVQAAGIATDQPAVEQIANWEGEGGAAVHPPDADPSCGSPGKPATPPEPMRVETSAVMIEVPVAEKSKGYGVRRLRDLSVKQSRVLRRVADGLASEGKKLATGKPVNSPDDAVVWLLEQFA